MNIIYLLLPLALLLSGGFVLTFVWATKKGQYKDLDTPANRMLLDDEPINQKNITSIHLQQGKKL